MRIKSVAGAATALTVALVLSGCAGQNVPGTTANSTPAPTSTPAASPQASVEHNQADITFAQGMLPHHQQAVEMSKLAAERAGSDDVRRLATEVEQAQGPEIATMRGFLAAWGAPASGGMAGMGHETVGHDGMAGMMTEDQMRRLQQADGVDFDRMFLEMMIAHHDGAVQMAQTELANGVNPEATTLAQTIIDAQRTEITEMRSLLG